MAQDGNDVNSSETIHCAVGPDNTLRKGPLNFDEALRLDGGLIIQEYLTKADDSDTQRKLSAWVRALGLAGGDRSVIDPNC